MEAGGFEVTGGAGYADAAGAVEAWRGAGAEAANIAVICGKDEQYPTLVPELARGLHAAGVRTVILAGNPGANESAYREAGVDRFVFVKCDVVGVLRGLLVEEGVLS
jgi:methylmalonyl-CoA mutase